MIGEPLVQRRRTVIHDNPFDVRQGHGLALNHPSEIGQERVTFIGRGEDAEERHWGRRERSHGLFGAYTHWILYQHNARSMGLLYLFSITHIVVFG